jgi:hypothetical protein
LTYRSITGCSKKAFSKAAASEEARRTLRYVEPLSDARTPLADFFSILLDDSMFQQIMQMHDSDNSLGILRDDQRGDRITLHHFNRLSCQLIRPD